jgi:hypothetical protein
VSSATLAELRVMIRFNPLALALAFGVAKGVLAATNFAPISWMMRDTFLGHLPFGLSAITNGLIVSTVAWNFVGGVIAGGLFALIYNKIAEISVARIARP